MLTAAKPANSLRLGHGDERAIVIIEGGSQHDFIKSTTTLNPTNLLNQHRLARNVHQDLAW
ncbi:hypothetical protein D3C78_1932310 [compost metagenome]